MFYGRGINKAVNPYTLKDMYAMYIKDKEENSPYYVSYADFVTICTEYYKAISEHILEGGIYFMPFKMGSLSVVKKRPRKLNKMTLSPDWATSQKVGKLVLHTNEHTDYYKYRFHWVKANCAVKYKGRYRLVLTRENKRKLASNIKSREYEYFEL